jgi:hypothetical protein
MKKLTPLSLTAVITALLEILSPQTSIAQQPSTKDFGQRPPGDTPTIFAPGFISKRDRYELMTAFAPDGKEFCFTVTNEQWSHFEIWHTLFDGRQWSEPEKIPFSTKMQSFGPAYCPANNTLFFSSANWVNHPATIWHSSRREGQGNWSRPVKADSIVNAGTDQWQCSVAADGTLVFASKRAGGIGDYDLYLSEPIGDHYTKLSNLTELNSTKDEYSAFIAPDKSYIIFSSQRAGGYGWDDLYISFRKGDQWSKPKNLGPAINTINAEFSPQVTPDGRFLIYSKWDAKNKWSDIYWVRIDKLIGRLKKTAD